MPFTNSITLDSGSWYWFCMLETSFKELVSWNKLIFPPPEWCSSQSVCVCVCVCVHSVVETKAHQTPLSMGSSRQEYWSGWPFPSPGDLTDPGIDSVSLMPPALAGGYFATSATWEAPTLKPHPIIVFDLWTVRRLAELTPRSVVNPNVTLQSALHIWGSASLDPTNPCVV